ncbi:Radical SAM domain protein [Methanocaldococcus infernus ME]|uniref:Radical SAM domain protein n=1 Tax=Methanocaldococcus infernus (strain DSM 11812 / JCM 15783 / ME) TaxID=573063 RepID=D5VTM7_METIM|nr:radical SAM protein [Methanocaldococcus infernus]ADG13930.1 Radical SAM domain protein [Methanocaldococcus infernus ME]
MNPEEVLENCIKAFKITNKYFPYVSFERALFLGWYCNLKEPCKFCYMSVLKERIKEPKKAKRSLASILAEAILMKRIGWKLEFISGGYGYSEEEINRIAEAVAYVQRCKQYLNVGVVDVENINLDVIEGVVGAVETLREREKLCPGKSLEKIKENLIKAKDLGLKTGITIILGLNEREEDIEKLLNLIEELELDRITFYSLNPQKGTIFENKPSVTTIEYMNWVSSVRLAFPKIKIITGVWTDKISMISPLILAGSNVITKFPLFSIYGTKYAHWVEKEVRKVKELYGTFTDLDILKGLKKLEKTPYVDEDIKVSDKTVELVESIKSEISKKINDYINKVEKRAKNGE